MSHYMTTIGTKNGAWAAYVGNGGAGVIPSNAGALHRLRPHHAS